MPVYSSLSAEREPPFCSDAGSIRIGLPGVQMRIIRVRLTQRVGTVRLVRLAHLGLPVLVDTGSSPYFRDGNGPRGELALTAAAGSLSELLSR